MGAPCSAYPKGTITSVSWTKRRSGLWVLNAVCMPQPAACTFPQKTSGAESRAGRPPRVLSRDVWARPDPHCRRASSSDHPSGDLRASCRDQYVGEPPQRSPLHTAEIHPRRERKMRGWPDRDIPRLAVQTAGIGASFPADAHDIRHGRQKFRFRLFECSPTHKKKWVTRVAQGAPGNAPGWL